MTTRIHTTRNSDNATRQHWLAVAPWHDCQAASWLNSNPGAKSIIGNVVENHSAGLVDPDKLLAAGLPAGIVRRQFDESSCRVSSVSMTADFCKLLGCYSIGLGTFRDRLANWSGISDLRERDDQRIEAIATRRTRFTDVKNQPKIVPPSPEESLNVLRSMARMLGNPKFALPKIKEQLAWTKSQIPQEHLSSLFPERIENFIGIASSGKPVYSPETDEMAFINLATLQYGAQVVALVSHDPKMPAGAIESVEVDNGELVVRGGIIPSKFHGAAVLLANGQQQRWQMSVHVISSLSDTRISTGEYINGFFIDRGVRIFDNARLAEVSFVGKGCAADPLTIAQFN